MAVGQRTGRSTGCARRGIAKYGGGGQLWNVHEYGVPSKTEVSGPELDRGAWNFEYVDGTREGSRDTNTSGGGGEVWQLVPSRS